jgi:hypothetical protein
MWIRYFVFPIICFSAGNFAYQGIKLALGYTPDWEFSAAMSFSQALAVGLVLVAQIQDRALIPSNKKPAK